MALRVLINGYLGKMGVTTTKAVLAEPDLELVGGFEPTVISSHIVIDSQEVAPAFQDLTVAIEQSHPDVIVDFTLPAVVADNLRIALVLGVDCVVGTTGLTERTLQELIALAPDRTTLFVAPNFTTGAVLMLAAAKLAARYFPDVEILEFHHNNKVDSPSGTAISTAKDINRIRSLAGLKSNAPGLETESNGFAGARAANLEDVRIHSIRSDGYMASQEIIFGSPGQTLSIRHDSIDRNAYMPGVLLAIRSVGSLSGLVVGLEELMEL